MKNQFVLLLLFSLLAITGYCQPDSFLLTPYTKWNEARLYAGNKNAHTAFKPILFQETAVQSGKGSLLYRKVFEEHLLVFQKKDFHLFVDFLPDFQIGSSERKQTVLWQNTRGFRISGSIGKKVYFESEDFETQQVFPGYIDSFARKNFVIPRLDNYRKLPTNNKGVFDFNYASARLFYQPSEILQIDLGYGKNFVGDGYRSLLLSDWSFNYPYLRVSAKWRNFRYSVMWSQYLNTEINQRDKTIFSFPKKWGQTFFLDWHFNQNGNIGIFESVVWPDQNKFHQKDINWTMLSPIIFLHGNHSPSGITNYTLTGLNAKYKILPRTYVYGQLAFSNLLRNKDWSACYGTQIGIRSSDMFGVANLDLLAEFNNVRPYMYAGNDSGINYTHFNQPMADPLGSAFQEGLAVLTYQHKKWWFRLEGLMANCYSDSLNGMNDGNDIFKPLPNQRTAQMQGQKATLLYGDFRIAYILNPKNNLRIEAGITIRNLNAATISFQDRVFMIGLRSSFRDLVHDF